MARSPRVVIPDLPHHVTQRGNRREAIFFGDFIGDGILSGTDGIYPNCNQSGNRVSYEKLRGKTLCCGLATVFLGLPRFSGASRRCVERSSVRTNSRTPSG